MREISVSQINGNEILAKNIYDSSGRVLLSEGTVLKPGYKMRLRQIGILSIYINDEFSKKIEIEDIISEKTRKETKQVIQKTFENFFHKENFSTKKLFKVVNKIIDDILSREEIIINLSDIKSKDGQLYEHSVNVCVLSIIMGIHLKYSNEHLKELAVGALLHDLGKLLTPKEILDKAKSEELNNEELEIMKKHPLDGYEILSEKYDISYIAKSIILMHHEHCDGTGFPLNLTEEKLHETVKIVCICNTFDNLTSDFSGCRKMDVYKALEYLIAVSNTFFDNALVNSFIKNVATYPSGSIVKLNNGSIAIVLKQNKSFPLRPIINVIFDEKRNKLKIPIELNLIKETTLFILDTVKNI